MSSVFRKFRKNQKLWLAVLGVLTMLSFVFIPIFMDSGRHGTGGSGKVVTTRLFKGPWPWSYESLTESQLYRLSENRRIAARFFQALGTIMDEKSQEALKNPDESAMTKFIEARQAAMKLIEYTRRLEASQGEKSLVEDWLQAQYAKKMGVVVSDETINKFVNDLARGLMTTTDFQTAKQNAGIKNNAMLEDALRELLLASEFRRIYELNFANSSVAQQWDNFLKANRSVIIDAVPVEVADYIKDVPDPTPAELQKFFDDYKDVESNPYRGQPGFMQRKQVKLQFAEMNVDDFIDLESVSAAEIREFYEKYKDYGYRKLPEIETPNIVIPNTTNPFSQPAPSTSDETAAPGGETPDAVFDPSVLEGIPGGVFPEISPETTEETAPSAEISEKPAAEEPATTSPELEAAEETVPETAPAPETVPEAEKTEAAEEAPTVSETEDAENSEASEEAPAPEDAAGAARSVFRQVAMQRNVQFPQMGVGNTFMPKEEASLTPTPEYRPLAEVEDDIRLLLAREKAGLVLRQKAASAYAELKQFQQKMEKYLVRKDIHGDHLGEEPPTFDFPAFAEKYGLKNPQTPKFYDVISLLDSPLGQAYVSPEIVETGGGSLTDFVLTGVMGHAPFAATGDEGQWYIGWKLVQKEAYVPNFSDEEEAVAVAWKLEQARPKAEAAAKKFAEEAAAAGSLAQFGDKVIEAGPFTWLTYGRIPENQMRFTEPELSQVGQIDTPTRKNAGDEFMKAVFSLTDKKCGVAPDESRSVYYVVQVKDSILSEKELQLKFSGMNPINYQGAASAQRKELAETWMKQLEKEAGLKWLRDPRSFKRNEE